MSWREMIDKRSSCRSFTGTPVAEKMLDGTLASGDTAKLSVEDDVLSISKAS